jgi:hypothetical protein
MISETEERFSHEAIERVVRQSCFRLRQRENGLYNQDVLDALHDLTGLDRSELAEIGLQERREKAPPFFSIKQQTMIASGFVLSFTAIVFLAVRLLS